jgi:class 3 adenylate cyclase
MDAEPGTPSPEPIRQRRTLAAIVFTDIVNYSAQMQTDEDRTLRLARRDLDYIRKVCGECEGKVLKNTGDGLLMYFDSAVQAVACAMQAQKALASLKSKLPPEEVLQHRIGIHLGDVFVGDGDVMGDGVNIASRLQAEAEPGGVCVSQTVYDVVKNRLGVKATYLGPRELKNIQEAVPVYQILLDAAAAATGGRLVDRRSWLRRYWPVVGGSATVLAAGAVVLAVWLGGEGQPARETAAADAPPTDATSAEVAPDGPVPSNGDSPGPDERTAADTERRRLAGLSRNPSDSAHTGQRLQADSPEPDRPDERGDPRLERLIRRGMMNQDFQPIAEYLRRERSPGDPEVEQWEQVAALRKLARIRVMTATSDDPVRLQVPGHSGQMVEIGLWMGQDRSFRVRLPGDVPLRRMRRLPAWFVVGIYEAVAQSPRQKRAARFLADEARRLGLLEHRPESGADESQPGSPPHPRPPPQR